MVEWWEYEWNCCTDYLDVMLQEKVVIITIKNTNDVCIEAKCLTGI